MRRFLRYLRIAWSVAWGLACGLLIVLWVRSYSRLDALFCEHLRNVVSSRGELCFSCSVSAPPTIPVTEHRFGPFSTMSFANSDKYVQVGNEGWAIPTWLPIVLAGSLLPIPWLRVRFSLRTLLIATTLIAAVLGLIVWLGS